MSLGDQKTYCLNLSLTLLRPIIVNFSFIVISCTRSSMLPGMIIWLFGKTFEEITMLYFVLSLYDKINKSWSNNQLSCGILMKIFMMWAGDYEWIINYDWPNRRKNTNKVQFFTCGPFSNIIKYRDHKWDLPTIYKTRFLQAHLEEYVRKFRFSFL